MKPAILLAVTTAGCFQAQLLNADLVPPCAPADPACATAPVAPLSVGASTTFNVELPTPAGGQTPVTHLRVANEQVAFVENGVITGAGEGVTALLVLAADDSVLDFSHIAVAEPERLEVHRRGDARALQSPVYVAPGEVLVLDLEVHSDSQLLSGDPRELWDVDNNDWRLLPEQQAATLTAPESGSTLLTVSAVGIDAALIFEVRP